ncbi:YedE family putative selenium transporter [Faecalibacterium duncaniae]
MKLFDKTWKLALSGVVIGLLVMLLAMSGNPANMAICVACFIRDAAGALKLHTAAPVQYFRPEIVGFVCGSFLISVATKEYRSTAGSAPMVRFLLGAVMMIGALVFLGCPLRMVLRMSAGDLNAYVALIGFAGGVATGSCFLKKGFSLGRAYETKSLSGAVLPVLLAALLVIGVATGAYAASTEGPGSKHAPLLLALVVALVIGALAQKSRMCFAGSIRDVILMKNFDLLSIIAALFVVMTVYNIATGNFHLSFSGQPIAHSQHLWNILGMYVVGFAAVLAGGCPLRQLILAGQGSSDSAVTFLGMLLGAAFAHNFNLVGSAAKAATATDAAVPGGPAMPGKIAVIVCIVLLFVIAATNLRRKKAAK